MADPAAPLPQALSPLAAKAHDLDALRSALVDAASVGAGLWVSYLFVLLYLLIAAGGVTHKDLFFETPVKMPFLSVDLPLKGFFVLGPLLFLIVHAYVLLHFGMLSDKVRAFDRALREQIDDAEIRTQLRRQLPSNIFVQFLAGPREIRDGIMGLFLWLITMISLVVGPVCLVVFLELQFLPYHSEWITWWQRMAVGCDLLLMWLFWPSIAQLDQPPPEQDGARQTMLRAERVLTRCIMWVLSSGAVLLMVVFATYPGEGIDTLLWKSSRFTLPRPLVAVREFLVAGQVNPASRTPRSLWSNRLVLPGLDVIEHMKLDTEAKLEFLSETASLRQRNLDGAVLIGAVLRKGDFTGASLRDAQLAEADLRQAKLACAIPLREGKAGRQESQPICTDLAGASLDAAQLQGASLVGAQLQGASLFGAQLRGASLSKAQLQGALLDFAQLQGASLDGLQLQGASLDFAQLQGASLDGLQLQGASLGGADLQGASFDSAQLQGASLDFAQLQGASLDRAQLQGASLGSAQLQGASLDRAQLQGASLDRARLEGASVRSTLTWRADAITAITENAWIEAIRPDKSVQCDDRVNNYVCPWEPGTFNKIVDFITKTVPAGKAREEALQRVDPPLNPDIPMADELAMADWWNRRQSQPPSIADYEAEAAKHWELAGCADKGGAPYVASRLARRMERSNPFTQDSPQPARLAAAFLAETCKGARGLPAEDIARLQRLRGPATTAPPPSAK